MSRKLIAVCLFAWVSIAAGQLHASLLAVTPGNDAQGLAWLNNNQGASGLTLLVKEDLGEGTIGPAAGGWDLTMSGDLRSGSWEIDDPSFQPLYWLVKFDGLIAIYEYAGPASSPWSSSFDLNGQVFISPNLHIDIVDVDNSVLHAAGNDKPFPSYWAGTGLNPAAATSHVSVYYGTSTFIHIPEPGSLTLWAIGLFGLAFAAGRTRRRL